MRVIELSTERPFKVCIYEAGDLYEDYVGEMQTVHSKDPLVEFHSSLRPDKVWGRYCWSTIRNYRELGQEEFSPRSRGMRIKLHAELEGEMGGDALDVDVLEAAILFGNEVLEKKSALN